MTNSNLKTCDDLKEIASQIVSKKLTKRQALELGCPGNLFPAIVRGLKYVCPACKRKYYPSSGQLEGKYYKYCGDNSCKNKMAITNGPNIVIGSLYGDCDVAMKFFQVNRPNDVHVLSKKF